MKKSYAVIVSAVIVVFLIIITAIFFKNSVNSEKPGGSQEEITITVTVDHLIGEDSSFTVHTKHALLADALLDEKLIAGEMQQYGLWIQTVDGETADEANEEWWGYCVNGEFSSYGVSQQPINDGDKFDFVLNVGY